MQEYLVRGRLDYLSVPFLQHAVYPHIAEPTLCVVEKRRSIDHSRSNNHCSLNSGPNFCPNYHSGANSGTNYYSGANYHDHYYNHHDAYYSGPNSGANYHSCPNYHSGANSGPNYHSGP